jgi:serine/threonine-protein kinase
VSESQPESQPETFADGAGRYRLSGRIATGGMGEVWRARDTALGRDVAVKLLKPEYAGDPVFRTRFEGEARHAARLHHPGVAAVYDVGEQLTRTGDVRPFLVMELVDGRPLSSLIRRDVGMEPAVVRDLLAQAGDALAAAHAAGIVHRDVKPANLLVTADRVVKVTDFGIARALSSAAVTGTGAVMGTPQYLSPEQARGDAATPASDVYGLGVVAYECLAGRRPFEKETAVATALSHLNDPVPPLPASVPGDLAAVVMRALAKKPAERYADAGAFAAALRGVGSTADAPTQVSPVVAPGPVPAADATQVLPAGVAAGVAAAAAAAPATPADGTVTGRTAGAGAASGRGGRGWLVALLVGLVLAAALVTWLLTRSGAQDDVPPAATQSATAATPSDTPSDTPTETPTSSAAPETFDLDESRYVGEDVDRVLAELRDLGLEPRTRELANPGDEDADTVAAVSPTKGLEEGDRVEVAYYGRPEPERTPTPQEPTEGPSSSSPTSQPTTGATTPQTAESSTPSTTTAEPDASSAARKDMPR